MIRFTFDIVSPKMTQPMVRNPLLVVLMLTVLEIGNPSSGNYHLTQASFLEVRISGDPMVTMFLYDQYFSLHR